VVMEHGRIRQAGPPREIYGAPRDRYVAEFIGGQNVLRGKVERFNGETVVINAPDCKSIVVPLPEARHLSDGEQVDLAVRRDHVRLMRPEGEAAAQANSPANALSARIHAVEYQGNYVKVMLETGEQDEFVAYVPEGDFFAHLFEVGETVLATWDAAESRLLA
jgi:putative spermidine/putrescine transport system ATP-binding protein